MTNLNLKINNWWVGSQYTAPGSYVKEESNDNITISTGSDYVTGACSSTKMSFTTPPFLSNTSKIKLQITAKLLKKGSCSMALSANNYSGTGSVMTPSNFQCNWMAESLIATSLGQVAPVFNGDNVTFTLDNLLLEPNKTYYLYFLRTGATPLQGTFGGAQITGYAAAFSASQAQLSFSIGELAALNYPVIDTTSNIYAYNSSMTLKWEKVVSSTETSSYLANPVKGYRIFLRKDSKPTEQDYDEKYETTNLSQTFSLAGIGRGKSIYIGIMTISIYDVYKKDYPDYLKNCNSQLFVFKKGQINNLPTILVETASNQVGGDTSAIFNLTYSDIDSNSQKLSGYFVLNSNTKNPITGNSLNLNLDQLRNNYNITETGEYQIRFYAYDGLEYSTPVEVKIYVEFAPLIKIFEYVIDSIKDGFETNQSQEYVNLVKSTFQLKNDVISGLSAKVFIKLENSEQVILIPEDCYKLEPLSLQKTISVDITKIPDTILGYGEQFSLNYEIINKDNLTSGQVGWTRVCHRPYKRLEMPEIVIENDAVVKNDLWELNFNKALTFNFTLPGARLGYPDISTINLKIKTSNNDFEEISLGKNEGQSYSVKTELINYINKNSKLSFSFELVDTINQKIESETYEYWRVGQVTYPVNSFGQIIPNIFNPNLDLSGIVITHPTAVNETNNQIEIQYKYKCQVSNGEFEFNTTLEGSSEVNSLSVIPSDLIDFNQKIFGIVGEDSNYVGSASITIVAIDAFGQESIFIISSFSINLITPPTFIKETFSIYRDLNTNPINYINRRNNFEKVWAGTIFNMGEGIIFEIPKPIDPNNDLVKFNIYLFRQKLMVNEYGQPLIPLYSEIADDFPEESWLSININECESTENYYYYRYSISSYKENEYFYFKIVAVDSHGNISQGYNGTRLTGANTLSYAAVHEPNYIIGARVQPSKIEIISTNTKISENSVTLNFGLKIDDLGGSATSENGEVVWNENYYALFNNFERQVDVNWNMKLKIEISPYQDFSKEVKYTELIYSPPYNFIYENQFVQIDNYSENAVRVYVKTTLEVSYSQEDGQLVYIVGIPYIYSHFDIAPTVSHRPHQIGINTAEMDNEENKDTVLRVDSYGRWNKVRLESGSNLIEIDLEAGTITGVIIDGGSW